MGLVEFQRTLATLYTDSRERTALARDRDGFQDRHELSAEESELLNAVTEADLARFARSLQMKRMGEVLSFLPLTRQALGQAACACFDEFWSQRRTFANSIREDAIEFAKFVTYGANSDNLPLWITELVRLEAASIELQLKKRRFRWMVLRHSPAELIGAAQLPLQNSARPRRSLILCRRDLQTGAIRWSCLSLPW